LAKRRDPYRFKEDAYSKERILGVGINMHMPVGMTSG
jgi:hypothetical protein